MDFYGLNVHERVMNIPVECAGPLVDDPTTSSCHPSFVSPIPPFLATSSSPTISPLIQSRPNNCKCLRHFGPRLNHSPMSLGAPAPIPSYVVEALSHGAHEQPLASSPSAGQCFHPCPVTSTDESKFRATGQFPRAVSTGTNGERTFLLIGFGKALTSHDSVEVSRAVRLE